MGNQIPLERVDANRWRIPIRYNAAMRVPGMVYADDALIELMKEDNALQQVVNVASLPGIVGHSLAMPDIHSEDTGIHVHAFSIAGRESGGGKERNVTDAKRHLPPLESCRA